VVKALKRTSEVCGQPRTNTYWHPEKMLGDKESGEGDDEKEEPG
jgi:hypothetical protein